MTIKHQFTASSGDLITSTRWNADHTSTEKDTIQGLTWLSEPDGFTVTCTTSGTWYEVARASIYIPGALFPSYNRVHTSVHWKANVTTTIYARIRNAGNNPLGYAYQAVTSGTYYTTLDANLFITFPTGNDIYSVWVKSDDNNTNIDLYNVTTWYRVV